MFPIRCFTCGNIIQHKKKKFDELVKKDQKKIEIFKKLKIQRYCCRSIFLTYIDQIDKILLYSDIKEIQNK